MVLALTLAGALHRLLKANVRAVPARGRSRISRRASATRWFPTFLFLDRLPTPFTYEELARPFNELDIMASEDTKPSFLDTLEGEITFFRSIMRARPIGIHRHFHMLVIRNAIYRDTGQWVPVDDMWRKLRECYDMDALEGIVSFHPQPF